MPSDRVFGLIERDVQKMETVIQLEEYHQVFQNHGTLKILGTDWTNCDWKAEAKQNVKDPAALHFQISKVRKLVLTKMKCSISASGENNYNMNIAQSLSITKKGKKPMDINPTELVIGVKVKPSKIIDVEKLLVKHYGENWKELQKLQWLKKIIEENDTKPELPKEAFHCDCENTPADECNDVIEIILQDNDIQ